MDVLITTDFSYHLELWSERERRGRLLHRLDLSRAIDDLVEEMLISGLLSEELPPEPDAVRVKILPFWSAEPPVLRLEVRLEADVAGQTSSVVRRFGEGPWVSSAQRLAAALRQRGNVRQDEPVYRFLAAARLRGGANARNLSLDLPRIVERTLDELGVCELGAGSPDPARPVLVDRGLAAAILDWTRQAGRLETGGAVLGQLVRLPAPLAGAATRVVTVLSRAVRDPRHEGGAMKFDFDPGALAEAALLAEQRGRGESVVTVFHSHGWLPDCAGCAAGCDCPLPESVPSLQDYTLLESLFSSKAALMPIAGRRPEGGGQRLALELFAWRSGALAPISWQQYVSASTVSASTEEQNHAESPEITTGANGRRRPHR